VFYHLKTGSGSNMIIVKPDPTSLINTTQNLAKSIGSEWIRIGTGTHHSMFLYHVLQKLSKFSKKAPCSQELIKM